MTYDASHAMADLLAVHQYYKREHGATAMGMTPRGTKGDGHIAWLIRDGDSHLYVVDEGVPMRCRREGWEALTSFAPPWPWADNDCALVIPEVS